jgi:stringent starvation protein B
MIPIKPYFLRAYFDWIVDNGWTPLVVADATVAGVDVPTAFVKEGKIVLNLSLRAIRNLEMENDSVSFSARFGGVSHKVFLPVRAVLAIYAEENGQILSFPPEPDTAGDHDLPVRAEPEASPTPKPEKPAGRPASPDGKPKGRPTLRVVKKDD